MTITDLLPVEETAERVHCAGCGTPLAADEAEAAPAGCEPALCGDCLDGHVARCGACAYEIAAAEDLR